MKTTPDWLPYERMKFIPEGLSLLLLYRLSMMIMMVPSHPRDDEAINGNIYIYVYKS